MDWGTRRKIMIIGTVFAVALAALGVFYFLFLKPAPSCSDKVQNQGELGVDCGGPCAAVCPGEATDLVVFWSRAFKVTDGIYDAAALVENPNINFGLKNLPYSFKIYDENNLLITERKGNTFSNPKERFVIFESRIDTGQRIPARATLELGEEQWTRIASPQSKINLELQNKVFTPEPRPYLTADLSNPSPFDAPNVEAVAVISDSSGNVIGVSGTYIERLGKGETKKLTFTWPNLFQTTPSQIDIFYRLNAASAQ
jgi:hypothetical protein